MRQLQQQHPQQQALQALPSRAAGLRVQKRAEQRGSRPPPPLPQHLLLRRALQGLAQALEPLSQPVLWQGLQALALLVQARAARLPPPPPQPPRLAPPATAQAVQAPQAAVQAVQACAAATVWWALQQLRVRLAGRLGRRGLQGRPPAAGRRLQQAQGLAQEQAPRRKVRRVQQAQGRWQLGLQAQQGLVWQGLRQRRRMRARRHRRKQRI